MVRIHQNWSETNQNLSKLAVKMVKSTKFGLGIGNKLTRFHQNWPEMYQNQPKLVRTNQIQSKLDETPPKLVKKLDRK